MQMFCGWEWDSKEPEPIKQKILSKSKTSTEFRLFFLKKKSFLFWNLPACDGNKGENPANQPSMGVLIRVSETWTQDLGLRLQISIQCTVRAGCMQRELRAQSLVVYSTTLKDGQQGNDMLMAWVNEICPLKYNAVLSRLGLHQEQGSPTFLSPWETFRTLTQGGSHNYKKGCHRSPSWLQCWRCLTSTLLNLNEKHGSDNVFLELESTISNTKHPFLVTKKEGILGHICLSYQSCHNVGSKQATDSGQWPPEMLYRSFGDVTFFTEEQCATVILMKATWFI